LAIDHHTSLVDTSSFERSVTIGHFLGTHRARIVATAHGYTLCRSRSFDGVKATDFATNRLLPIAIGAVACTRIGAACTARGRNGDAAAELVTRMGAARPQGAQAI
jgi:hypothetical protein